MNLLIDSFDIDAASPSCDLPALRMIALNVVSYVTKNSETSAFFL